MKLKNLVFFTMVLAVLFVSGCAPKVKPTDYCRHSVIVSHLYSVEDFNYIDFLDLAVEVSKESSFPPPMHYDQSKGLLVFGHVDVDTMPGHKMVVYMWVDNPSVGLTEQVCVNYQILDVKGAYLTESTASRIIIDFIQELEEEYSKKLENTLRLMDKYQVN